MARRRSYTTKDDSGLAIASVAIILGFIFGVIVTALARQTGTTAFHSDMRPELFEQCAALPYSKVRKLDPLLPDRVCVMATDSLKNLHPVTTGNHGA